MKRAFVVIVIIGAAFLGYRYYERSGPDARYQAFADAVLHRQYDAAAAMTEGLSSAELQRNGTQEKIGAGPAMFQTLFPSRFQIEKRDKAADGTLTLTAIQTVLFNPPGVESAVRPAMFAKMNQTVTMRKSGGDWKVVAFDNRFGSMDSLSGR